MELCKIEEKAKRIRLDEINEIRQYSTIEPSKRFQKIQNFAKKSASGHDPVLKEYGILSDIKALEVNGRILPAPDIEYGNNGLIESKEAQRGSWRHDEKMFHTNKNIQRWIIIDFCRRDFLSNNLVSKMQQGKFCSCFIHFRLFLN